MGPPELFTWRLGERAGGCRVAVSVEAVLAGKRPGQGSGGPAGLAAEWPEGPDGPGQARSTDTPIERADYGKLRRRKAG